MKRFACILAIIVLALPAWSAKKVTVAELTDTLKSLSDRKAGDADVAAALKQLELSEQLTRGAMNDPKPAAKTIATTRGDDAQRPHVRFDPFMGALL